MAYDKFIKIYSKRGRIEPMETPVGKLDIHEELALFKDASKLYRPDVLIELLGGARLSIEEELKEKKVSTRFGIPMRVKRRSPLLSGLRDL